jgi:hypothetical protein
MRTWIIFFWVFIVGMLVWQFYSYNQGLTKQEEEHPTQQHFFFYQTNAASLPVAPAKHADAYVEQTGFTVENDTPGRGSFTCHVTLKNNGEAKATGVQVKVRPYRGIEIGDADAGPNTQNVQKLDDNDPLSQMNQWVSFPDLAPGESSTQSAVFLATGNWPPGDNPKPEIVFDTAKTTTNPPTPSP